MATRLATNYKVRSDITSNITPPPWVQENIQNPQGAFRPAAWLPVVFTKYNTAQGTDYFVISSGKVVALTRQGEVVPAGLRASMGGETDLSATTDVVLTYTSDDYDCGVIDLTTGVEYATDGTTSYTGLQVANALIERGLVPEDVIAANPPTTVAHIGDIIEAFISRPVGVILYDVYKFGGRAEDGNQFFTNDMKQDTIQFVTEWQMKVPHRVATEVDDELLDVSAVTVVSAASAAGDFPQPGEVWDAAGLEDLARYDLDGDEPVVAIALANKPVATNTDRTPISCDLDDVLVKEVSSIAALTSEGQWYLDREVGLLFIHEDTWDTLVTDDTDPTFTYWYYDDAATGASSERYIYFDGEVWPGCDVSMDEQSNFVRKGSTGDVFGDELSLGKVMYLSREPKSLMTMVKSAYNLANMPKSGKMPGTATKGFSDMITLPDEPIADQLVILTVRI